jgi:hypothetical protein
VKAASAPKSERRNTRQGLQPDRDAIQTNAQQLSVSVLERSGWKLLFVRRPLFQGVTAVLKNQDGKHYAGIDERGNVIEGFELRLREVDAGHETRSATWYAGPTSSGSLPL